jgi:RNA polymerase sigma-70 factor (ECF subfamily)
MAEAGLDVAACVERVRRRDEAAARELVEHLFPLVIKIVRSHLRVRLSEEDLAQDVFLKMFSRIEQYRGVMPFEHWVARIAVSTCLDALRAQRRRPELRWADLSEDEESAIEAVTHDSRAPRPGTELAARELAEKLMDSLGPEDRLVVRMLDLEQHTLEEIAAVTGWNRTVIKVRAFRARRKMRKYLEKLERTRR